MRSRTCRNNMARLWEVHFLLVAVTCVYTVISQSCNTGEARLQNGTSSYSGRVELCMLGNWVQICDSGWSLRDAEVLCRQLNFSVINAQAYGKSLYGSSTNPIAFTDFQCLGNETDLINCAKSPAQNCTFDNTAGVDCQGGKLTVCEQAAGFTSCCLSDDDFCMIPTMPKECFCDQKCHNYSDCCDGIESTCPELREAPVCSHNEVKLVGGRTQTEGRLELCVNGQWSTVCNQHWNSKNADVVCRQLQLDPTGSVTTFFGQGNVSILVSNFQCNGSERLLVGCNHTNTSVDCGHQQDVGINCTTCLHGSILVHGGHEPLSGQVELCWMGKWVNICEDDWSKENTNVACRQIGYSGFGNVILAGSSFGNPRYNSEPIELRCNGSELNVTDCPVSVQTVNTTCLNQEIAGIQCHEIGPCEQAGLTNCCIEKCEASSGCYCDSACLTFGDCCDDFERVCQDQECSNGNVRLSHGHDPTEGIVQLCMNAQMGLVCGTSWSADEAQVLCRSIGLPYTGAWPTNSDTFSANIVLGLPVVAGDFNCTGDESSLLDCSFSSVLSCGVDGAVGVVCESACSDGDIRLVNGSSSYEGRVEVCMDEVWGTVCDQQWTTRDAEVVCKQLNLTKYNAQALGNAYFGQGILNRPIFFTDSQCTGVEANITECLTNENTSQCTHAMDAGVKCAGPVSPCLILGLANNFTGCCINDDNEKCEITQPAKKCYCDRDCYKFSDCCDEISITCPAVPECNTTNVRIVDGPSPLHGRVEVCADEHWSTVCDNHWDDADATVVCKNLTNNLYSVKAYNGSVFGEGSGPIRVGGFQCNSLAPEMNLLDCIYIRSPDCSHKQDAGVECVFFTNCTTLRQLANFTGCCIPEDEYGTGCAVTQDNGAVCYCDAMCRTYNDCCDDIDDICPIDNSSMSVPPSHIIASTTQLTGSGPLSSTSLQQFSTTVPPVQSTPSQPITSSSDSAFSSTETANMTASLTNNKIDATESLSSQYQTISESVDHSTTFILSSSESTTTMNSLVTGSISNPLYLTSTVSTQLTATTSTASSSPSSTVFTMPLTTAPSAVNIITLTTTASSASPYTSSQHPHSSTTDVVMFLTTSETTTAVAGSTSSILSPTNTPGPVHHSDAALANTVEMTLAMHTVQQFSKVTEIFKTITASAINTFCDHNEQLCASVADSRKRQSMFVNEDGIVITATTSTATGLRIVLYAVLINGGVLPRDALENAIQNAVEEGLYSGIGELNVMIDTTTTPLYLILTISASGTILAAIAITIIIIGICICCCTSSKRKNAKVPVQRTNRVILNTGTQSSTYTFAEGPPACFDYTEEPKFTRIPGLPEYYDYTERLETAV